jgi:hypothetical protein
MSVKATGNNPRARPVQAVGGTVPLARRLRNYTVAVSTAALIAAGDALYSRFIDARIVKDAIAGIHWVMDNRPINVPPKFRIEVAGDLYAENPDNSVIASAVRAAMTKKPDAFVILFRSDKEFMQAATYK